MPFDTTRSKSPQPNVGGNTMPMPEQGSTTEIPVPTLTGDRPVNSEQVPPPAQPGAGGLRFWLIFAALMVSTFLSALDLVSSILHFLFFPCETY